MSCATVPIGSCKEMFYIHYPDKYISMHVTHNNLFMCHGSGPPSCHFFFFHALFQFSFFSSFFYRRSRRFFYLGRGKDPGSWSSRCLGFPLWILVSIFDTQWWSILFFSGVFGFHEGWIEKCSPIMRFPMVGPTMGSSI